MTTTAIENFRLNAARDLMRWGWAIFPLHHPTVTGQNPKCSCGKSGCTSIGKHPRTITGLKEAVSNSEAFLFNWWQKWPAANAGIATGPASGIVVLDIDPKKGGWESFAKLTDDRELPETVEVDTGGGGRHLYFLNPSKRIPNSTCRLGPGLDIRGDGGYVVAPTSLHHSGKRYLWRDGCAPGEIEIAAMPEWLISILVPDEKPKKKYRAPSSSETAQFWLGKALAQVTNLDRNNWGYWLSCQLRDNGVSLGEAEGAMLAFQSRCPASDHPYSENEAIATVRSCYKSSPRDPAQNLSPKQPKKRPAAKPPAPAIGATSELREYMDGVASGKIYNASFPWPILTSLTFALLPGTTTCLIGDPGVGKTFAILQCLQHWASNAFEPAVFFIEKDRRFHTMRLLAQLEGSGNYVNYEWIPKNTEAVSIAMDRHAEMIEYLGQYIHSSPSERVTLDSLLEWIIEQAKSGKRIIVVDPITAVSAGDQRWAKDDDFMIAAEKAMTTYGSSLVLVTHSKKGNRVGPSSGHDIAGGAAYFRFADTVIWISLAKKPKKVQYRNGFGIAQGKMGIFFQLHKTRSGRGSGMDLAFTFGEGLKFVEQGVVLKELPEEGDGSDDLP